VLTQSRLFRQATRTTSQNHPAELLNSIQLPGMSRSRHVPLTAAARGSSRKKQWRTP